jgi:hypothetical protein
VGVGLGVGAAGGVGSGAGADEDLEAAVLGLGHLCRTGLPPAAAASAAVPRRVSAVVAGDCGELDREGGSASAAAAAAGAFLCAVCLRQ